MIFITKAYVKVNQNQTQYIISMYIKASRAYVLINQTLPIYIFQYLLDRVPT